MVEGSGMGEAVAKAITKKGWKVAILDMSEERGSQVAQEIDGIFVKTDVTNYNSQAAAFQNTYETYGQIDFGSLH